MFLKIAKALLQNKLDKAGDVILCDNKAKNAVIAIAIARLFNAVSVQKNKPEWSCYFVTMPNFQLPASVFQLIFK
ncbi:MAG: hypothetical protein L3J11_05250 [Draconibacterium sp.]|nr:hypothetical protein [Draconibacterium sp.]